MISQKTGVRYVSSGSTLSKSLKFQAVKESVSLEFQVQIAYLIIL